MAKKHLIAYYLEQQALYFEMLQDIKDVDKDYKEGRIDPERYNQLMEVLKPDVEILKGNYERLSYVMLLLNKPTRDKKGENFEKEQKEWYDRLQGASREAIYDESKDALADFKRLVREELGEKDDR